ncbi:MAG: ABC transporter ATP-binding protein [Acidimicrobiia bacterium]
MSERSASAVVVRAIREVPPFRVGLAFTLVLVLLGTGAQVVVPIYLQRLTDAGSLGSLDPVTVLGLGAGAATFVVAGVLASRAARIRLMEASTRGLHVLRTETFARLHAQSVLVTQERRRGALIARVTNDVERVQEFMEWGGVGLLVGSARVVVMLGIMVVYSWQLALLVGVATAVYGGLLLGFQRVLARAHDTARLRVADVMATTGEAISGLPIVRTHGAERHTLRKLDRALFREFRADFRAAVLGNVLFATAEAYAGGITAGVLAFGIWLGLAGEVTAGVLVAFFFLVALLVEPVQTMVETLDPAQAAGAGLRRIFEVHDEPIEVADPGPGGTPLPPGRLGLELVDLGYTYPDGTEAVAGVTLTVAPGERVAIVGETGSGKTTFAKLAARILERDSGDFHIGGVPIDRIPFASLRRRVTYVPQEGFLHDDTIEGNVRYGRLDATRAEVEAAFADLGLAEWVASLPEGLDTRVGERGGRLSAGERQLVALVRASIADPDLLVLDEATSSVDPALEVGLRRALEVLLAGRTSLTIAHRLSTAEAADRVLVFDGGRIVEDGTHAELVATGGVYAGLHADWIRGTRT